MLVLSRKTGERIHIGSNIIVTVLETSGSFVKIGLSAPTNVSILRGEIKEQIESENKLAAGGVMYIDRLKSIISLMHLNKKK